MAGTLPQGTVEDDGGGDLHIAVFLVDLAPIVDEGVFQHHPLGEEEGETGALVGEHKEAQFLAQLAVIPALGLLDALQVGFQFALFGEGGAVDPAEHLVLLAPPPVGAGAGGEFYRLHRGGGHQVGAGAEVGKVPLAVEADLLPLSGVLPDQFLLVGLVLHQFQSLGGVQFKLFQGQVRLDDGSHLLFQLDQVLGGEGGGKVEIVIEAVVDGRADGELGLGVEVGHRLGQDVGGGVVKGPLALLVGKGEDLQGAVMVQNGTQVHNLAVHPGGAGGPVQAHTQVLGGFGGGDWALVLHYRAVLQSDLHGSFLLLYWARAKKKALTLYCFTG